MTSNLEFEAKTAEDAVEKACNELGVSKKQLKYDVLSYGSTGIFGLVGVKKARIRVYLAEEETPKKEPQKKGRKQKPRSKSKPKTQEPNDAKPLPEEDTEADTPPPIQEAEGETSPPVQEALDPEGAEAPQSDDKESQDTSQEPEAKTGTEDDPSIEESLELAKQAALTMAKAIAEEATSEGKINDDGDIVVTLNAEKPAVLIGRRGQTLDAIQYLVEKIINRTRKGKVRVRVDAGEYLAKREETLTRQAKRLGAKVKKSGKPASFSPMSAHDRRIVHLALKNDPAVRTQSRGSGYLRKLVIFPQKKQARKPSK